MALATGLGVLGAFATGSPPEVSAEGLAELLGRAADVSVRPNDIVWEPGANFVTEALLGRRLLFLGAARGTTARDLYRARVRLGYHGQPLSAHGVRNLTRTPLGDETELCGDASHAAFASVAYGAVQAISVLDLSLDRRESRTSGWLGRIQTGITNLQMTGSWAGIARTDILLQVPAHNAELSVDGAFVHAELGTKERAIDYDLAAREARGPGGAQAYGVRVVATERPEKTLVIWGVDTVREEIGPEPIAWLEEKVFAIRDVFRRGKFALFSKGSELRTAEAAAVGSVNPSGGSPAVPDGIAANPDASAPAADGPLDGSAVGREPSTWPPSPISSLWKDPEPGEGTWLAVTHPFLRASLGVTTGGGDSIPAYFAQTFIRPDSKRPYAKLWLIAMDMRQLELAMQAGFEDPEPLTGPPGEGRLPDDGRVGETVVAAFNGAFKTEHGRYGMMVARRVLLPPMAGAATVWVDQFGEVGLGSWPKGADIPPTFVAYRQNLDPLVEDGVANPTGRQLWGWQIEGKSVLTERTALCVTDSGNLYYAWGEEIDGPTMGVALKQAGCSYALHLDMNPGHCGFIYTRVDDWKKHTFTLRHAVAQMSVPLERYVRWSPKDFFYVSLRSPVPSDGTKIGYVPDGGLQPPPGWWPGIYRGDLSIGGLRVEISSFEPGRVELALRAGTKEPTELGAPLMKTALVGEDRHRVLGAVGLGTATRSNRPGIAFDGQASIPMRPRLGTLILDRTEGVRLIAGPPSELAVSADAVQLPLLAVDGELTEDGRAQGPMRSQAGLCVTEGGRLLLGRAEHDSPAVVATALLSAGCRNVVRLDRGSSDPPFLHRSGTELPPTGDYETTVLYVLSRPMVPHAKRWRPAGAVPSTKPTGYDIPARRTTRPAGQ